MDIARQWKIVQGLSIIIIFQTFIYHSPRYEFTINEVIIKKLSERCHNTFKFSDLYPISALMVKKIHSKHLLEDDFLPKFRCINFVGCVSAVNQTTGFRYLTASCAFVGISLSQKVNNTIASSLQDYRSWRSLISEIDTASLVCSYISVFAVTVSFFHFDDLC